MEQLKKILDEIKANNYKCIINYESVEKHREELELSKNTLWRDSIKWDNRMDDTLALNCRTEISNILDKFSNCDLETRVIKEKELLNFMRDYLNK
ncbi:MAG: hypothetical protein ACRC4T_15600 [Cetobacterium sp.]